MEAQPTLLAGQFAALRATAAIPPTGGGWIPASVQALIMACLARIFGRLEQIFLLWQSASLPPPASPRAPNPAHRIAVQRPRTPGRLHRRSKSARHRQSATSQSATSRATPALRAPNQAPRVASSSPITSATCPHAARDPPYNGAKTAFLAVAQARQFHYDLAT